MLLLGLGSLALCLFGPFLFRLFSRVVYNLRTRAFMDAQNTPTTCERHWLFGHMLDFFVTNGMRRYEYSSERMRDLKTKVMRLDGMLLSNKPVELHLIDPVDVEHMLKTNVNNYIKDIAGGEEMFYNFRAFLGEGIFATSHGPDAPDKGASWYLQRKITAQMFTTNEFKNFIFESFVEKADILVEQLNSSSGKPVDLQDHFFRYTMDSFGLIAFNAKFDTLEGMPNEYAQAFDGAHSSFMRFYAHNMLIALTLELSPASNWIRRGFEWFLSKVSPELIQFQAHRETLQHYTKKVIKDRLGSSPEELKSSKDILGLFIKASDDQKVPFSEKYLTDVVLNLIIAGRDTTACLLSWTFYELARNPDKLNKLREELKDADSDDYESMKNQPYLTSVFYEAGRLWPSVPMNGKISVHPDVLPSNGTKVPSGAMVWNCPYAMGRDPDLWDNPMEFLPERWLVDGKFKAPSPFKYPVFQAGPRVCLGMNFALMEASIATVKLLESFDFELVSKQDLLPDTMKMTMSMAEPLSMILKPRQV